MDLDFGYSHATNSSNANAGGENANEESATNLNNGNVENEPNGNPADDLDNADDNKQQSNEENKQDEQQQNQSNVDVVPGSTIEIGDDKYTVDDNGNVLDTNGNIFKEANQVQDWLKGFENVEEANDGITINSIQEAIGVDIMDGDDKPVVFENSPEGIKNYVNAVIQSAAEENYQTAINTLYQKYPILNEVINYYVANGNSLEGFRQLPDRSGITIDDNNEEQQEAIIRTAWEERNQKGDVNSYIAYLKSSGILLATAQDELENLKQSDEQVKNQLAEQAQAEEEQQMQQEQAYWQDIYDTVQTRKIAGYQIPENIIVNKNGQKFTATPDDFFNYIYNVDAEGKTAYQRELEQETAETLRDDNLLRAYLKFVGGNYSNLVDMAINDKQVAKLRLKAKENRQSTVRVTKPTTTNKNKEIDLGYN